MKTLALNKIFIMKNNNYQKIIKVNLISILILLISSIILISLKTNINNDLLESTVDKILPFIGMAFSILFFITLIFEILWIYNAWKKLESSERIISIIFIWLIPFLGLYINYFYLKNILKK